jgi:hypothetical protein
MDDDPNYQGFWRRPKNRPTRLVGKRETSRRSPFPRASNGCRVGERTLLRLLLRICSGAAQLPYKPQPSLPGSARRPDRRKYRESQQCLAVFRGPDGPLDPDLDHRRKKTTRLLELHKLENQQDAEDSDQELREDYMRYLAPHLRLDEKEQTNDAKSGTTKLRVQRHNGQWQLMVTAARWATERLLPLIGSILAVG